MTECFRVPIPVWSALAYKVSPECVSFLRGLLDVRIPLRLGSPHSFDSFSTHPWFRNHHIPAFDSKMMAATAPPFTPNLQEVEDTLIFNLSNLTQPESGIPRHEISPLDLDRLRECFNSTPPSSMKDISIQPTFMSVSSIQAP